MSCEVGNKIIAGYTAFRDYRVPFSRPYPVVDIFNQNGQLAITAGSEMFSTHNVLNQDIYQIFDNMTVYENKHTITGGVDFEYFGFENSFNLFYYPWDKFFSVKSFLENDSISGVNFDQQVRDSQKKPFQVSYLKLGQLALYAQDEWQISERFNLTYGLLYVPANKNDIHFGTVDANGVATTAPDADAQWTALNNFIEQDKYLSTRRGKYAQRNGAMLPWYSQLDFKFLQSFAVGKESKHKIQVSLDILNLGNMINSNWGIRKFARTTDPIKANGVDVNGVPYFKFDTSLKSSYVDDVSLRSKWQMQIGLRYIFN